MSCMTNYFKEIDDIRDKIRSEFGISNLTKDNIERYTKMYNNHQHFIDLADYWKLIENILQSLMSNDQ